ncbi:MAG: delta-60 repeat domain-containing protein [Nocardioides sp.]
MSYFSRRIARASLVGATLVAVAVTAAGLAPASADTPHPAVVSDNPANYTPSLVEVAGQPKPIVDAIAVSGNTVAAGGRFTTVTQGGTTYDRQNLVLFDADDGEVRGALNANNRVWAAASFGDWLYVGGQFTAINGVTRRSIVRINATTGQVDPGFRSAVRGRVNVLVVANNRLYVGGSFAQKVVALNLETGANTGHFDLAVTEQLPNSWGAVTILGMSVNPQGTRLVATGNFRQVAGQARSRLFVADVSGAQATLDPWYYNRFASACSSSHPRRIAYLQGVDFSPDGQHFSVAATGQVPRSGDRFETVCDGIGRFSMADDSEPEWINYTGGDSVWAVSDTGSAVYAQGHFQWLDNPFGFASRDGGGAARRLGIGAIDPQTGLALPWAPEKRAQIGGRSLVATSAGLWVGSDSEHFNGEPRRGIAFAPLP